MNENPMVELEDVYLDFGDQSVLEGTSLSVCPQERFVIMGRSGSGKSTLLRLILGILQPTRGDVRFDGQSLAKLSRRKLNRVRRRVGMVYQYSALISSLTVAENLALPLTELTRKSRNEIETLIDEKLEMVGMKDMRQKMPAELSGGMRKRIGLARGIILDPELILFDEPTAGLDPVISSVINELIIELTEKIHATSIIVTHEMDSAFKVATRMAMLYEGKLQISGTPDEIRSSKDPVVAQFISGDTTGPIQNESS